MIKMKGCFSMAETNELSKEIVLEDIIVASVKIPGVKVNRNKFIAEQFADSGKSIQDVIDLGPVECGFTQEELSALANRLIIKRTSQSSLASFAAGIPGGLAMAATIPADVMQFFGMALRLAQELSYLYGADDLWENGQVDDEKVKSQLIMYCGVMFGVSGAVSGVRVLSTQIAKTTLKKLPQKALTKTFWYPIVKQIGKTIGVKVTKTTVAQGVSKAIPIVGGIISGSLNFASMMPMANRLQKTFDKVSFDYSEDEFNADIIEIENISSKDYSSETESNGIKERFDHTFKKVSFQANENVKNIRSNISSFINKREAKEKQTEVKSPDPYEELKKIKELLDLNIISQEEFDIKKKELLNL